MNARRVPFALILLTFLLSPGLLLAQEPDPAVMERMMTYATPAKQHETLGKMVGEWKTTVTFYEGDHSMTEEGLTVYEWSLGDRYLEGTFEMDMMGQPFVGKSIDGYDIGQKRYISIWMDNMSTGVMYSEGGANPGGWEITFTGHAYNHIIDDKATYETVRVMKEDDQFTMKMYMLEHQGKKTLVMEALYDRIEG